MNDFDEKKLYPNCLPLSLRHQILYVFDISIYIFLETVTQCNGCEYYVQIGIAISLKFKTSKTCKTTRNSQLCMTIEIVVVDPILNVVLGLLL